MLNPEQPITPEDAAPAARDIVRKAGGRWREGALVSDGLTKAPLRAGLGANNQAAAAVLVLQKLIRQTEDHHWKADWDNHSLGTTPFRAVLNVVMDDRPGLQNTP